MKRLLTLSLVLCASWGIAGTPQFSDPAQEAQYYDLIRVIRCPTCQNQNIAESDAPLARQLREQVEAQIKEGRSDQEISAYLVERYGDFITYSPPFAARTWILWFSPFVVMAASLVWWFMRCRHGAAKRLNSHEQAELRTLLNRYRKQP